MGRPCGAERVSSIHRGPTQYLATLSSPNSYSITIIFFHSRIQAYKQARTQHHNDFRLFKLVRQPYSTMAFYHCGWDHRLPIVFRTTILLAIRYRVLVGCLGQILATRRYPGSQYSDPSLDLGKFSRRKIPTYRFRSQRSQPSWLPCPFSHHLLSVFPPLASLFHRSPQFLFEASNPARILTHSSGGSLVVTGCTYRL